jgi:lysyl-tRNA synthetase, class II
VPVATGKTVEEHTAKDFVAAERDHRLAKLDALRERGINPYPVTFDRDTTLGEIRARHGDLGPHADTGETVRVAGRVTLIRHHGGVDFLDLRDQTGTVQLLVSRGDLDPQAFSDIDHLDRGDWVGAAGTVVTTDKGELSVRVKELRLLSKSLRALPDKHRGLTDVDTRLRERYLDLIANPEERRIFDIRSAAIASVRQTLGERGFTEVETPVLDTAAGGAAARPFVTHHNALDIDMYMRIALELPLKRLVVGGFERVFEIGRVFRNEGLDTRHNPEFTLLEAYQALADYHDMMDLVEAIVTEAAERTIGTTEIEVEGKPVSLAPPWRRITMADLIEQQTGARMHPSMPVEEARAICDKHGVPYEASWGAGRLMSEVYDETCEHTIVDPTFVYDYPREVSPLARVHRDDELMTERFECVVAGRELANAYSELNDPVDQRRRFEAEAAAKAAGDEEAEDIDEDYIRALEYGLPPTGGLGIGLDRMVMLLTGADAIRDVILFPTMRPESGMGARATKTGLASSAVPTAASLVGPAAAPPAASGDGAVAAEAVPAEPAPTAPRPATELPHPRAARVLSWLTGLLGVVYLLAVFPGVHDRLGLGHLLDESARVVGHVASVLIGLALVLVAFQLGRRKHRAWQAAIALFALAALAALLKGPHPIGVIVAAGMAVALAYYRDAFTARPDPASLAGVLRFVPVYLGLVVAFGAVTLLLEQDHVQQSLSVFGILGATFAGLVGASGPYDYTGTFFEDFFPAALLALGIAGLAILSALVFRAVRPGARPTEADRRKAEELVRAYGSDTLDYFALREDKSWFFSSDGNAMVAFAYVSGYALVSADPIGAPASIALVLDEFLAYCRDRGWHVAFLAVREDRMPLYRERGFRAVYLGDEAIIRCDTFDLSGSSKKAVRSAVSRLEKGHSFKLMRETDASPQLRDDLNAIRERWRGKAPERGFTMELGGGVRGEQPDFLLAVAFGKDERPVGFLRLVPCYGDDPGYSLDLMQRDPDAPNGITEFLIANAALALGERGFRRLSMNFAAWGRLFDSGADLSPRERMLKRVAEALNPFFQIKSLRDFNEKFDPEWLPRSIAVEDPGQMPRVGLLYASVEGFLDLPLVGRYLVPSLRAGR